MQIISGLLLLFGAANSFSTSSGLCNRGQQTIRSQSSDDSTESPSDVDVLNVESEDFLPTDSEATITSLLDLVPNSMADLSNARRTMINEVILKLEALNPTKEPAMSPLVNGVWDLKYAAGYTSDGAVTSPTRQLALFLYSGGYSPGLFALSAAQNLPTSIVDVRGLEISISREQPRIQAKVDVKTAFDDSTVEIRAKLEIESDVRLRETYESATIMGRTIEFPDIIRYSRELFVTYVDEEILIVRDGSGVPELLIRK